LARAAADFNNRSSALQINDIQNLERVYQAMVNDLAVPFTGDIGAPDSLAVNLAVQIGNVYVGYHVYPHFLLQHYRDS
jgi:hypothetical protein